MPVAPGLLCPATNRSKDRDTLIEQSNFLLKQSVNQLHVPCQLTQLANACILGSSSADFWLWTSVISAWLAPSLRNPGSTPEECVIFEDNQMTHYSLVFILCINHNTSKSTLLINCETIYSYRSLYVIKYGAICSYITLFVM